MIRKALIVTGVCSGLLLAFLGILAVLGSQIDPDHHVVVVKELNASQEKVWNIISDVSLIPKWNEAVQSVHVKGEKPLISWQEEYKTGHKMNYRFTQVSPPHKLIREVADADAPFSGEWIIEIQETDNGSEVKITENGHIENPLIRFIAHKFMGIDSFISQYIDAVSIAANEL